MTDLGIPTVPTPPRRGSAKYFGLTSMLTDAVGDLITVGFAEVEAVLGFEEE